MMTGQLEPDPWRHASVAQLRALSKERGLRGYSKLHRNELIAALEEANVAPPQPRLRPPSPIDELVRSAVRPRIPEGKVYAVTAKDGTRVEAQIINAEAGMWRLRGTYGDLTTREIVIEVEDRRLRESIRTMLLGNRDKTRQLLTKIQRDYWLVGRRL